MVDDGSSEDVTAALTAILQDPRARIVRQETNKGVAAARNSGASLARGTLIAFLAGALAGKGMSRKTTRVSEQILAQGNKAGRGRQYASVMGCDIAAPASAQIADGALTGAASICSK
jgi:hypothetical protein